MRTADAVADGCAPEVSHPSLGMHLVHQRRDVLPGVGFSRDIELIVLELGKPCAGKISRQDQILSKEHNPNCLGIGNGNRSIELLLRECRRSTGP